MNYSILNLLLLLLIGDVVSEIVTVDLTHTLNVDSAGYPTNPSLNMTITHRGKKKGAYWYETNSVCFGDHTGTHLDAPAHFYEDRDRVGNISVNRLVGPAVVLSVVDKASSNPDYRVSVDDIKEWESEFGRIPNNAIVIMNSGWSENYPNKTAIFGTSSIHDTTKYHFPAFHFDAADWLIKNRRINMIGVDTPSTDFGQSTTYPVHVVLAKNNIPSLENVANVNAIPQKGATIFVGALKLEDASGTPVRIVATYDDQASSGTQAYFSVIQVISVLLATIISSSVLYIVCKS